MRTRTDGHHPLRSFLAVVTAALLAACSIAGTSPAPSGSPVPATSPTAGPTGTFGHSTDGAIVLLRAEQSGGFIAPSFNLTRLPIFTLYGDGTVLYQLPPDPNAGVALGPGPLARAQMNPEQVDALLTFALGAGGLEAARAQYLNPLVMDAPDTLFTITTDEVQKTVSVQALSEAGVDPTNPDAAQLTALARLYQTLADFRTQVARGNATDAGYYEPAAYRAVLQEGFAQPESIDWPWSDLTIDDFVAPADSSFRTAVLTREQAAKLATAPQGGLFSVGIMGPDRTPYTLSLRPLLPDETS